MDGHNMIFAVPSLQRLQRAGRGEEARAGLAERIERFAAARRERVLVVFDGASAGAPAAIRRGPLEIAFSRRGPGGADERILLEARACVERGDRVTVVTNDIHTLARVLPPGASHMAVEEFWLRHIETTEERGAGVDRPRDGDEKRIAGDFSDLERAMLAEAARAEADAPRRSAAARAARPAAAKGAGSAPRDERARLLEKREKGRLRHLRRLGRTSGTRRGR